MRHVVPPLDVPASLQSGQRGPDTGLNVVNRVVPPGLPGNFQSRTAHPVAMPGEIPHGFPYLLYLTDAQLCLIEHDEMLVQVVVAIQHIAARAEARVAPGPAGLLHVVLQGVRYVVVHHEADILLVNAHPKGRRGHDGTHPPVHESILVGNLFLRFHPPMKRQCLVTIPAELLGQFLRSLGP